MIPKPIDNITKADIESLVVNKVAEGRTIDYKQDLLRGSDDEKKEFLADVSSFANAAGGDLIIGVQEAEGVPERLTGLAGLNSDSEKLRLDNLIRDGIDPRIPGVQIRAIDGFPNGPVLIIRVPKSWSAPHMVALKKWSRFFTRNNAGKYQMDTGELRSAFVMSEALPQRIRDFRTERLGRIVAGETPVPLEANPKIVLHLVPIAAFLGQSKVDLSNVAPKPSIFEESTAYFRYNLEGIVTGRGPQMRNGIHLDYCQVHRNGIVEWVDAEVLRPDDGEKWMTSRRIGNQLITVVAMQLNGSAGIQFSPPVVIMVSLLGVKGYRIVAPVRSAGDESACIDRDVLLLPEEILEEFPSSGVAAPLVLRPILHALCNAAGLKRCFDYDENGDWRLLRE